MSHTYVRLIFHAVFSTKNRLPYLVEGRRADVFSYMGGILREIRCESLAINGPADHVHLVFRSPGTLAIAEVMQIVKGNSSKWVHDNRILKRAFEWQRGYAAFSVSQSNVNRVLQYVANQNVHHRKISFQEELRELLTRHGIEYDERYLWD
jgi:REP-associated tyrosine transposase